MENIKLLTSKYISENRWAILSYCFLFAVISTIFISLFKFFNFVFIGIAFSSLIIFIFYLKANEIVNLLVRGKEVSKKDLFGKPINTIRHIHSFLFFIVGSLASFLLFWILSKFDTVVFLVLIFIVVCFTAITGIVSIYVDLCNNASEDLAFSVHTVFKEKRVLMFYILKYITIIIQGSIIVALVNIFAFGPQIQETLARQSATTVDIMRHFTNPVSEFIQVTGVQVIMFYAIFVGMLIYKVFSIQKGIHRRRMK